MRKDQVILHHYEESPYAEKIRLLFGRAGLSWYSVLSPPMPPRPNVDPLAGGYRRIPVAQVGADVFCDTALIASELAQMTGIDDLSPDSPRGQARSLVDRAQGDVFFAALTGVAPLLLLKTMLRRLGPVGAIKFARDRVGMMSTGTSRPPQGKAAARLFRSFVGDLDRFLADQPLLSGDEPGYADASVFHPLFLRVNTSGKPLDDRFAHVRRWYERVAAMGHGKREELAPEQAFAAARTTGPRPLPAPDSRDDQTLVGRQVTVAPSDYGAEPVHGTLVAALPNRLIVARDAAEVGRVHVHFPRSGYSLQPA